MPVATKYIQFIEYVYYSSDDAMRDLGVVEYVLSLLFESIERLVLLMMMLVILFSCLALILFVTQGIALYKLSKQQSFVYPWIVWIPVAHLFVIPLLTETKVHARLRGKFTLLFGLVLTTSIMVICVTGWIWLLVAPIILFMYGFYVLTKSLSEDYWLHVWLAIVTLGVSIPFQLLQLSYTKP